MNLQIATIAVLALAVLLASMRLLLGWRRQRDEVRAWRPLLLLVLQVPLAVALYCTLYPPQRPVAGSSSLTVLTEGASARDASRAPGPVLALPEAPAIDGVARVPDLATALRRHPGVVRVEVAGHGLVARDRHAAHAVKLVAPLTPLPPGLQRLDIPARNVVGETLVLTGQVGGTAGARVELRDPADRRIDAAHVDDDGGFRLSAPVLAAGRVVFGLHVVDKDGRLLERAPVPIAVGDAATPRVQLLAGAPSPETRALQRWMQDAGFRLQARISLGAGMQLGNAVALTDDGLGEFDLLLVDARAWADLGAAGRATVLRAVDAGLGLLLRADTPMPSSAWASLRQAGFDIVGGASVESFGLAAAPASNGDAPGLPDLSRRNLRASGDDVVALAAAADGTPLGWWRRHGRGRIGVWAPVDTWRLPLLGHRDLHARLWNGALAPLLRAVEDVPVAFDAMIRVGERTAICGAGDEAVVEAPDETRVDLLVDPMAAGCAAFWPRMEGWHRLQDGAEENAFFVHGVEDMPAERAARLRAATLALAARPASPTGDVAFETAPERGSPWPWFAAWLLLAALAWTIERAQWGRSPARH